MRELSRRAGRLVLAGAIIHAALFVVATSAAVYFALRNGRTAYLFAVIVLTVAAVAAAVGAFARRRLGPARAAGQDETTPAGARTAEPSPAPPATGDRGGGVSGAGPLMPLLLLFLLLLAGLLLPSALLAQAAADGPVEYRAFPLVGSRVLVWVLAQLHLLFAAFVLGVPSFVVIVETVGAINKNPRLEDLAREFTKLLTLAFSLTATFGGILTFALFILYPKVMDYLSDVFSPTMYFYAFLFFGESFSLYFYYYAWDHLKDRKRFHIAIGVLLNVFGILLMLVTNAWLTFMMSPAGIDPATGAVTDLWQAIDNPTWWPFNIHRLIANMCFGGSIAAAYCAIRFLGARTAEERSRWDWMGYVGNLVAILALIPLPFAGYWLGREIYAYSAQMGTTLMGGTFSWLFIIQAVLIGVLFIGANYYLWIGLRRIPGGERYMKYIIYMEVLIFVCQAIWMTPHTLVASLVEARRMGSTHHPILGVFGVMSAKNTVVNLIILTTFLSFLMYRRANKKAPGVTWARWGQGFQALAFAVAAGVVIYYGVYGYFVPADVRIGFSVYQVLTVLTCMVAVFVVDLFMYMGAETMGVVRWGEVPARSQYTLILIAVTFILLMGLMGYARSGIRLNYHVDGVARMLDTSPDAFTPTLGFATTVIGLLTLVFIGLVALIFWLASLPPEKERQATAAPVPSSSCG